MKGATNGISVSIHFSCDLSRLPTLGPNFWNWTTSKLKLKYKKSELPSVPRNKLISLFFLFASPLILSSVILCRPKSPSPEIRIYEKN